MELECPCTAGHDTWDDSRDAPWPAVGVESPVHSGIHITRLHMSGETKCPLSVLVLVFLVLLNAFLVFFFSFSFTFIFFCLSLPLSPLPPPLPLYRKHRNNTIRIFIAVGVFFAVSVFIWRFFNFSNTQNVFLT